MLLQQATMEKSKNSPLENLLIFKIGNLLGMLSHMIEYQLGEAILKIFGLQNFT